MVQAIADAAATIPVLLSDTTGPGLSCDDNVYKGKKRKAVYGKDMHSNTWHNVWKDIPKQSKTSPARSAMSAWL